MQLIYYWKIIAKSIMIFFSGVVLGVCLLVVSFLLPTNQKHLEESRALIDREAWYPAIPELSPGMYFETFLPGVLDNSSDCIMLYTAMDDSEGNPLVRAMDMYSDYSGKYSYYWHGYVMVLRPLALLFNYSEIRVLNGMLQMLLIAIFVHVLWRKKGMGHSLLALLAYFLLMPGALSVSLQYSWVFYIAFLGALFLVNRTEYWEENHRYLYCFLVLGMLTSYFDLLTYPLFTWGFPILMLLMVSDKKKKVLDWIVQVILSGSLWVLGYGGMWYLKWVLGTWILKRDILQQAIDEIFLRVGVEDQVVWSSRWNAIAENWAHYEYIVYILLILVVLVAICFYCVIKGWKPDERHFAFGLIAVSPFVWYGVLTNHTTVHHLFTYRIFCISILAVVCAGLAGVEELKKPEGKMSQRRGRCIWAGISVLAVVVLICCCRQDEHVFNGSCPGREVLLAEGETLVSEFHPRHRVINRMSFYLSTQSTQGNYCVELYDGEVLLDARFIPMDRVRTTGYFSMDVDWKLDPAGEYYLAITALEGNAESYILVANAGEGLLPEYGENFALGDQSEEGQIIARVNYRYHMLPEGKELFYKGIASLLISMLPVYMVANIVCIKLKGRKSEE